jgi:hypothetical protein
MPADRLGQGRQQRGDAAHPLGHGRAIEIGALTGIDAALAMQRRAVGVFRQGDVSEQTRIRPAALDRQRRRRRLHDRLAGPAAQLRPQVLDHLNADGTYSSTSVASSPSLRITVSPQQLQAPCGVCVTCSRGRCAGSGLRPVGL